MNHQDTKTQSGLDEILNERGSRSPRGNGVSAAPRHLDENEAGSERVRPDRTYCAPASTGSFYGVSPLRPLFVAWCLGGKKFPPSPLGGITPDLMNRD